MVSYEKRISDLEDQLRVFQSVIPQLLKESRERQSQNYLDGDINDVHIRLDELSKKQHMLEVDTRIKLNTMSNEISRITERLKSAITQIKDENQRNPNKSSYGDSSDTEIKHHYQNGHTPEKFVDLENSISFLKSAIAHEKKSRIVQQRDIDNLVACVSKHVIEDREVMSKYNKEAQLNREVSGIVDPNETAVKRQLYMALDRLELLRELERQRNFHSPDKIASQNILYIESERNPIKNTQLQVSNKVIETRTVDRNSNHDLHGLQHCWQADIADSHAKLYLEINAQLQKARDCIIVLMDQQREMAIYIQELYLDRKDIRNNNNNNNNTGSFNTNGSFYTNPSFHNNNNNNEPYKIDKKEENSRSFTNYAIQVVNNLDNRMKDNLRSFGYRPDLSQRNAPGSPGKKTSLS